METYKESLGKEAFARYMEKVSVLGDKDPYALEESAWSKDHDLLPDITYPDLVNYLIFQPSPFYQLTDFRNYKSLECYDRFVCGWVRDVRFYCVTGQSTKAVRARVLHSQRLSEPSLNPWIIAGEESKILSAHCDCKAGLGECCSHIASLLFYLEATTRLRQKRTVTEVKAYWMLPTSRTGVSMSALKEIDFTSAKALRNQLDRKINSDIPNQAPKHDETTEGICTELDNFVISQDAYDIFYNAIKVDRPSMLSVNRQFNKDYVPESLCAKYPLVLSELRDENCTSMSREDLLEHCQSLLPQLIVTDEEAIHVEAATRGQANSALWHRFRTGRTTASKMKSVCSTSTENPSMSLLRQICRPSEHRFKNDAMKWGCEHEETARKKYFDRLATIHNNCKMETCGLFLNSQYPHIGASPDGLVECDCCGKGCIEVKCPFCMRNEHVKAGKHTCLEQTPEGLRLKRTHAYYYQVQTQMFMCEADYCDFIMWTKDDIFVERIEPHSEKWEEIVNLSSKFFATVVLPELVAGFYSVKTDSVHDKGTKKKQYGQKKKTKPLLECVDNTNKPEETTRSKKTPGQVKKKPRKSTTKSTESIPSTSTLLPLSPRNSPNSSLNTTDENINLYCICKGEKHGTLIACDSNDCPNQPYEWFHLCCMKLKEVPTGDWYCPDCLERKFLKSLKCKR